MDDSSVTATPALSTVDRILDAAEGLFADRGYAGTAVRDIAAAVSLNPASLYNHFPGKKGLYEVVLDRGMRPVFEIFEDMARMAAGEWSRDEFWNGMDRIIDHFAAKPEIARLVQHEALAGGDMLAGLAVRWLAPIFADGVTLIQKSPRFEGWEREELPLLMATLTNLVIGYFANASLLEKIVGEDPLSGGAVERQRRFLHEAIRRLVGGGSGRDSL
jgi:AcrR family transcriptional regulator